MEVETIDDAAGTLVIVVRAAQIGAVGRVEGRITCQVAPAVHDSGATDVAVRAELQVTGRLLQLAGGLIGTVARQVFGQFAACARRTILAQAG
jgi:carbon monoxide dehydrogenase subunit G